MMKEDGSGLVRLDHDASTSNDVNTKLEGYLIVPPFAALFFVANSNNRNARVTFSPAPLDEVGLLCSKIITAEDDDDLPIYLPAHNQTGNHDADEEPTVIPVTGVTLSQTSVSMTVGETLTLTDNVAPDNGTNRMVTWTTSDAAVATVTDTGVVTAVGEGTADADKWTASPNPAEAGETVTVTYSGKKKVKSVTVTKKEEAVAARALSEATAEDAGKVAGQDGNIYDNADAATAAGTTAVAKIVYVGSSTGNATYNHGLALALSDEGKMNWSTAGTTCSGKNSSLAVTGASWMLASQGQWNTMISAAGSSTALRDGFSSVGGTNMQSDNYWSSSVLAGYVVYFYYFSSSGWGANYDSNDYWVRACLAF